VKSQSNPVIAGSCRNMPKYSLLLLAHIVKTRMENAGRYATVLFPTQKICAALQGSESVWVSYMFTSWSKQRVVKVPKYKLSVTKVVCNRRQRGGRLRGSHPLKKA